MSDDRPYLQFRRGALGWERYHSSSETWCPIPPDQAVLSKDELCRQYAGYQLVFDEAETDPHVLASED